MHAPPIKEKEEKMFSRIMATVSTVLAVLILIGVGGVLLGCQTTRPGDFTPSELHWIQEHVK